MVKILVTRFGKVDEGLSGEILDTLKECYTCLQPHDVQIVDLYLFQRSSTMNALLSNEKGRHGIATSPLDVSFLATHDAWLGTPRVMMALDRMLHLSKLIRLGAIRHEAAHTVLHGSLEYYVFSVPTGLMKLEKRNLLPRQSLFDTLYLVSIAVKDYEVTRLLYERGYVEDQVAYSMYLLKPSREDLQAWTLTQTDKRATLLLLVSVLKTVCCAAPLLEDEQYGRMVAKAIDRSLSYLPDALSRWLLGMLKAATDFTCNTHRSVELFTNKIVRILDEDDWL